VSARKDFEKWAGSMPLDLLTRDLPSGRFTYIHADTNHAWLAWKESRHQVLKAADALLVQIGKATA
jgi:hypothetical protein